MCERKLKPCCYLLSGEKNIHQPWPLAQRILSSYILSPETVADVLLVAVAVPRPIAAYSSAAACDHIIMRAGADVRRVHAAAPRAISTGVVAAATIAAGMTSSGTWANGEGNPWPLARERAA